MPDDSQHDLDEILTHRAWVAGLARSLLFDQAQVDDVVQETWLVALKSRPRDPGATRAWLGGIVRNLVGHRVRGDSRRRRREAAAALPVDAPDAAGGAGVDDVVAQTELHRSLVEAVLALDEPYRTTVLLRYFRDLSAEEIARRTNVPGSTVRNRLRRALELLRTRLDSSTGGTPGSPNEARRAWMLALVPLALAPEVAAGVAAGAVTAGTSLGTGVAIMTVKTKLVSGLVAVMAALGGVWWALEVGDGAVVEAPAGGAVGMVVPKGVQPGSLDVSGNAALPTVEASEPEALAADPAGAETPDEAVGDLLTGFIVDPAGKPIEGAEVRFAWHSSSVGRLLGVSGANTEAEAYRLPATEGVPTDELGRFQLKVELRADHDSNQRTLLVVLHPDFVTRIHVNAPLTPGRTNDLGRISMAIGATLFGRTVDELGNPLEGVAVELLEMRPTSSTDMHSGADLSADRLADAQRVVVRARTDGQGRFRLTGLAPGDMDLKLDRADLTAVAIRSLSLGTTRPLDLGTWTLSHGRSLWGVVRLDDGTPAAGAQLYVLAHDAPHWYDREPTSVSERLRGLTTADEVGRFRFGGLADADYSLHARTEATAFTRVEHVVPDEGPLEITLSAPGEILLHVEDAASGAPLATASVGVNFPERYEEVTRFARAWRGPGLANDLDAPPGTYRIVGAGREGTLIQVRVDGYRQEQFEVGSVGPGQTEEKVLSLESALALTGFVIDDAGEPVDHASVQIASREPEADKGGTMGAYSDAQGSFILPNASAGDWTLWANHDGHLTAQERVVHLPREVDPPYVIRLPRHGVIEGVIRDAAGLPVSGAHVVALPHPVVDAVSTDRWRGLTVSLAPEPPDRPKTTRADENGVYRFLELYPAEWTLVATHTPDVFIQKFAYARGLPTELPEESAVAHAVAGETTEFPLLLVAEARATGRITEGGVPVVGALVQLVLTPDSTERWLPAVETHTDEHGQYSLQVPDEGPAVLSISAANGYPHLKLVQLLNSELAVADLDIAGATLSGRVVDAGSREPLAGAEVEIVVRGRDGWQVAAVPGLTSARANRLHQQALDFRVDLITDADGRFAARNFPAATYSVYASASAHIEQRDQIAVPDGKTSEPVTLALPRAAIVTGTVTSRDGTPKKHVLVELHPRGGDDRIVKRGYVRDGRYTIDPVDAGAWELRLVTWDDKNTVLATELIIVGVGDAETVDFVVD